MSSNAAPATPHKLLKRATASARSVTSFQYRRTTHFYAWLQASFLVTRRRMNTAAHGRLYKTRKIPRRHHTFRHFAGRHDMTDDEDEPALIHAEALDFPARLVYEYGTPHK